MKKTKNIIRAPGTKIYDHSQTYHDGHQIKNDSQETEILECENDRKLVNALRNITDRGNNAEVKKQTDGTLVVYEVKKNKVTVD